MRTAVLNPQHLRHPPPPPSSRVSRIRSATAERRRVAINLLQSVDLTEMGEGKLDPTIGRNEGKYMLPISKFNETLLLSKIRRTIQNKFSITLSLASPPRKMVSWFHEGGRDETCHLPSKNNYIFIEKNFAFHTVAFPMQFHPSNNVKSCHMLPTTSFLNKNLFYSNAAHWSFWSWENSLFRGTCQPNSFKRGSGGVFTTWFLMLNSIN